jgi:hypothetical protein
MRTFVALLLLAVGIAGVQACVIDGGQVSYWVYGDYSAPASVLTWRVRNDANTIIASGSADTTTDFSDSGEICGVYGGGCYTFEAENTDPTAVFTYSAEYYGPNGGGATLFENYDGVTDSQFQTIAFCIIPCDASIENTCGPNGVCVLDNAHDFTYHCTCDAAFQGDECDMPACTSTGGNLIELDFYPGYDNDTRTYAVTIDGAVAVAETEIEYSDDNAHYVCAAQGSTFSFTTTGGAMDVYVSGWAIATQDPGNDEVYENQWFGVLETSVEGTFTYSFVFDACGGGGGDDDCYHGTCVNWLYGFGSDCDCVSGWDSGQCDTPICPHGLGLMAIDTDTETTTDVTVSLDGSPVITISGSDDWDQTYYVCSAGSFSYTVTFTDSTGLPVEAHVHISYEWVLVYEGSVSFTTTNTVSGGPWNPCTSADAPCEPHGACQLFGESYNCTCDAGWENPYDDCSWEICDVGTDTLTIQFEGDSSFSIVGVATATNIADWESRFCVANNTCYDVTINGEHSDGYLSVYYGATEWFSYWEFHVADIDFTESATTATVQICLGTAANTPGDESTGDGGGLPPGVGAASSVVPAVWAFLVAVLLAMVL